MANVVSSYKKTAVGRLYVQVKHKGEAWQNLGLVSEAIITDDFIALLVSVLSNGAAADLQSMKYHAAGSGNVPESPADTTLGLQIGLRAVGTQTSTGPGNYRSVGTITFSGPDTVREHGLFSQAAGGVLMDRSVFAGIAVYAGTLIQFTYDLTIAGS